MKKLVICALLALAPLGAGCCKNAKNVVPKTEEQKTLYALGLSIGRSVSVFHLTKDEVAMVESGLADAVAGNKPLVELQVYGPKLQELARARAGMSATKEKEKGQAFLAQAAKEPGIEKTNSGMLFKMLSPGNGPSPKATDFVKVNYHGTLSDGTVFDSTKQRGPAEFSLSGVIPCWTEGMQKMQVGGKAKLICPSSIAYGDQGRPPKIPGGAPLIFEVELLEIKAPPPPGAAPQMAMPPRMMGAPGAMPPRAGNPMMPPRAPAPPTAPKPATK